MTRIESFRIPSRAILLGISLQLAICLAGDRVPNDRTDALATVDQSNVIKIHQKLQNDTNQTTLASDPTGPLLVDPNHGLERAVLPTQVISGSLAAPTERPTAPSQGDIPFQSLSGNMTVYVPTPTLIPTATVNVSVPYPTPTANSTTTNSTYNDTAPITQSTTVAYVTVDPASSTPTPAQVVPEPSTSTTIVYATAPPTIPSSSSSGSANTSGAYSLSAPLSLSLLMASVTTAIAYCVLFGQ